MDSRILDRQAQLTEEITQALSTILRAVLEELVRFNTVLERLAEKD